MLLVSWLLGSVALAGEWRLVGAYDGSSLAAVEQSAAGLVWAPSEGMDASCGPVKHPDGLGIFEAEAVGNGLSPSLVLVLERTAGEGRLDTATTRVALEQDGSRVLLQPMVLPRHLRLSIGGEENTERYQQLVRTQLEIQTCLEHKTGRAWQGQDKDRLRQAFLLDSPAGVDASRRFFGGQADPVPALIGPPDACLLGNVPSAGARESGKGEGTLDLVPTDVWGAALRPCPSTLLSTFRAEHELPLRLTGELGPWEPRLRAWHDVAVTLTTDTAVAADGPRIRATLAVDGATRYEGDLLAQGGEGADAELRIIDLLAQLPLEYPTVGPAEDPDRYTVLVVPDWQIVEALRRFERGTVDDVSPADPMRTLPTGVSDGVGVVLARPELLLVQVAPDDAASDQWPDLAHVLNSATLGVPWGSTVGTLAARSPVVLAAKTAPSWWQTLVAQRGIEQSTVIASLAVMLAAVLAGLRRVKDLWSQVPHERAHYWPGLDQDKIEVPGEAPKIKRGEAA